MAEYTGYVNITTTSYETWKSATLNNSYDADIMYSYQCWDYISEFWWNVGFPMYYPTLNGTVHAYEAWSDREQNAGDKFDLVYRKQDIKKGDIIVYNQSTGVPDGHMGFADEDYNGTDNLNILSQNNGETFVNIANYDLQYFLGAFRYKNWQQPVNVTLRRFTKSKFPFVLYARKLRNNY